MKNKLTIFKTVAHYCSFTRAAEKLYISQPAISKAIRNIELEHKTTFFIRKRNSIELTEDGKLFLVYVNKILDVYSEMENHFLKQQKILPDIIHLGASTTIGNYILPKVIARFRAKFPDIDFELRSGNSETIETLITDRQLDFGITEGKNTNPQLQYRKLIKDEIVLVTNVRNKDFKNGVIDKSTLMEIPIVGRESGSGTKEIINKTLHIPKKKKLNNVASFSSTEAIRNYLYYSNDYALLSINSVTEDLINNKLRVIDIRDVTMERWFYFVSRTGFQSDVMDYIANFIQQEHN
ncbi:LysR substrate-binding domain-containing protein [Zhouia spongiae]|uniref:LysR substrate-binding domain-containing protein n=1 Tax=Zhouia spongiae TaxID=2202721 RepID=A0ABY3YJA2_9FLAO|nr:LysR substrate-binding domain-containing protein [Zhouia spongiae]UNY97912.1 LysR substrate-binding domain-containing protein [Zhouia spongiae]